MTPPEFDARLERVFEKIKMTPPARRARTLDLLDDLERKLNEEINQKVDNRGRDEK